ncbi:MAG: AAA domain-containing protein [Saprospiraceae bacterium]
MGNQQRLFEQSLKEERKNQYRKTLYWFASPTSKSMDIVDVVDLYPTDNQFPNRWVKQILETTNPSSEVRPNESDVQKLKSIYYEHRMNPHRKVGFGYPMLVMKDTTGQQPYVAAPLFVWNINMEVLSIEENHWRIYRSPDLSVTPNELLIEYLEKQGIEIRKRYESTIYNNQINSIALQKLCNDIAIELDLNTSISTLSLSNFPSEEETQRTSEGNGEIFWAGIVGLFDYLPTNFLKNKIQVGNTDNESDDEKPNEKPNERQRVKQNFRKHNFTSYTLDPYQANAMRGLTKHNRIAVQGNSYTGIYDFACGTAANTLSNGGKVLVVSKQETVLNRVAKSINSHLKAEHAAVVLHDLESQKEVFYTILRQIAETSKKHLPFDEEEYQLLVNVSNRLQGKLDAMHDALNEPIFKNKIWIELIGDFLKNHEVEGRQLLNSQLLATDYSYDEDSYDKLKELIRKGRELYQNVNTLRHPLEVLHQDIFANNDKSTAQSLTEKEIGIHSQSVSNLYHSFVLQIEEYGQALQSMYERYHDDLNFEATDLQEFITDNQQRFGDDFNKWNVFKNFKLRFFSLFNDRYTTILKSKQSVLDRYQDLKNKYYNKRYFDYSFMEITGALSYDKIVKNLEDLKVSLRNWKQEFPVIIHNEIQRLSPQTIHPDLNYKSNLTDLNAQLNTTLTNLNNANFLTQDYGTNESFLINNKAYLERVMDQLEGLTFNLRDFDGYYDWKNYWTSLSEANQKLLKAFITTKPNDWEKAFDSWFLHQVLSQYQDERIPNTDNLFHQYFENHDALTTYIPKKIENHWTYRRSSVLRDLRRRDKMGFSTYFGKPIPTGLFDVPLDRMFSAYRDTIFNVIPVFCTTPEIAANYLDKNTYETVIILEADNMVLEEGYPLLDLANEAVVCGSGRLKRIGKSETLMEYAKDNYQSYKLTLESEHKHLYADFINRAYHRGKLNKGIDITSVDYGLSVRFIEGHYDEETQCNEEEVEEVVKILNELRNPDTRYLPKVGIVCFTKSQRNCLYEKLKYTHKDDEVIAHFFRNDMTICTIEEVVAQNFDITIISTTFSNNSNINVAFNSLSTEEGQYWIYHLLTSANKAIIACTSLTEEFVVENRFNHKNTGLSLLCTLLDFINANEDDDADKIATILAGLHSTYMEAKAPEKLMVNQIRQSMHQQFEENRVQGSIYFDLAKVDFWIKSIHETEPPIAIIVDSFFWQFPKGDYFWDKLLRETVKKQGLQFHPVWSVDWWKYPEKTPQRLAEYIHDFDAEFDIKEAKTVTVPNEDNPNPNLEQSESIDNNDIIELDEKLENTQDKVEIDNSEEPTKTSESIENIIESDEIISDEVSKLSAEDQKTYIDDLKSDMDYKG